MDSQNTVNERLEWLRKKDDTVNIISVNADGSVDVETDLDFGPSEQEVINSGDMLNEEAHAPNLSIMNRVVQIIFLGNASFSFIVMIFGFIPYYILSFDEQRKITFFFFGAACVMAFVLYLVSLVLMIFPPAQNSRFPLLVFLVLWMFSWLFFVGTLSAVVKNIAPLQAAAISFVQSVATLLLISKSRRNVVDLKQNFLADLLVGFCVWLMGIYSFVNQGDWISAGLLVFYNVASAAYLTWEVSLGDRFCLSTNDKIEAVARFYMDPILKLKEFIQDQMNPRVYEIPAGIPNEEEEL